MEPLYQYKIPAIIFGRGAIQQLGVCAKRVGAEKVFLVTDPGIIKAGWVNAATSFLKQEGIKYEVWDEVTPNPRDYEVERGTDAYLQSRCDVIMAVGGGSPIDLAKAVAVMSTHPGTIHDYEGVDKIKNPFPPMVMVPSTAGSGADITQFAVVSDLKRKHKMILISKSLIPDISVVDPLLLTTKDPELTANTGMDTLAHAIESYVSTEANFITDAQALTAIQLIFAYLGKSVVSKTNLKAKDAMAKACLLAAAACSNALIGAVHAMAHQVGGMFDLPHGKANAILLPYVMEYNYPACIDRLARIAVAAGVPANGRSLRDQARSAIEAVKSLARELGVEENLSAAGCGVSDDGLDLLSRNAASDACLITNPRDMDAADMRKIFYQAN